MYLAWVFLLITATPLFAKNYNKDREAFFDRNMRGDEYNVADTGIMMGLGKRSYQPLMEDSGSICCNSNSTNNNYYHFLIDLPDPLFLGSRVFRPSEALYQRLIEYSSSFHLL